MFLLISDVPSQSRNFEIYRGFSYDSRTLLYKNNATYGYTFTKELSPPVFLKQLEITKRGVLTICELELFEIGKYCWIINMLHDKQNKEVCRK